MRPDDDARRPPGRSDDELLRRVHERAAEIRSRRRGGGLAAAVAVVVAVVGVLGLTGIGDDDDRLVRTASGPPTSGSQTTTTISSIGATVPGPSTTLAAGSPTPTTAPAPSTTVNPCRNSHDPACGPFYFDPPPDPDQPMTVEVIPSVSTVRVGEPMSFHIIRRDADGVSAAVPSTEFGDIGAIVDPTVIPCDRFGPWDPPPKNVTPVVVTDDVSHTYILSGVLTATFGFYPETVTDCKDSLTGRGENPYASSGEGSAQVTVLP